MTEAEAEEAIRQRWITLWSAAQPTVPFTLDNEAFDSVSQWARLTIVPTVRSQTTMGASPKRDTNGQIMVQLFGSIDTGGAGLATLVASVRAVFERKRFGSPAVIVTRDAPARGPTTDGRWYMRVVSISYEIEEQA